MQSIDIFTLVKLKLQLHIVPVYLFNEFNKILLGQIDVCFFSVVGVEGVFNEESWGGYVVFQHVFLFAPVRHLLEVLRARYDVPECGERL